MKLRDILSGKKTYGAALTAILGTALAFQTGQIDGASAIQIGVTGVLAALLRSGSKADAAAAGAGLDPK